MRTYFILLGIISMSNFIEIQCLDEIFIEQLLENEFSHKIMIFHCNAEKIHGILTSIYDQDQKISRSVMTQNLDSDENFDQNLNSIQNEHDWTIFLDLNCTNSGKFMTRLSKSNYFNGQFKWIIIGTELNSALKVLKMQNINVDSRILLILHGNYSIFRVSSASLRRGTVLDVTLIGKYEKGKRFKFEDPFKESNLNLNGTFLRVAVSMPKTPQGISFKEFALNHVISNENSISRNPLQILQLMAQKYNFKITLRRCKEIGLKNQNDSNWNGILGMLQRNEADLTGTALIFGKTRLPIVGSGFSVFKYRQFLIFRHPTKSSTGRNVFLMPLSDGVWWSLMTVTLCTIITLITVSRLRSGGMIVIVNVIGMLSQQGISTENFSSIKARGVTILFLFLSFICFQFYSASIVGSLLTTAPRSIRTLDKLTQSHFKVILEDTPISRTIFSVGVTSDVDNFYEKKVVGNKTYLSVTDGIAQVKKGSFAFLVYVDEISDVIKRTLTHNEIKELQEIPLFPQDHRAFLCYMIQKNSPFKETIRVGTLRLIEIGLKSYHGNKWTVKITESEGHGLGTAIVDFDRVSSIFYFLFTGYLISFLLLLCEFICTKIEKLHQ
uniref:CSON010892 protein n=1 Tax=Culicoides sonorensis TaxID=179676 RepID=A0A336M2T7_CULSO